MQNRMNDVRPFRAIHYDPKVVGDVGPCLSQPYDVISPAQQETYYRQHPNNVVRLILNKIEKTDTESDNRYTRAKGLLEDWRKTGVLHPTRVPSFWMYEQQFDLPDIGRKKVKGFIGAVRLRDYEERRILPHEKVIKGPLEDRIRLTQVTNTQFEYIWSLYRDEAYVIDDILDSEEKLSPIIDYYEPSSGVNHRMWRLMDPATCDVITRTMADRKIYIADGHHRYKTMLTIRDEMRRRFPDAGPDAPWEFIMMFLTNTEHEGLTILPTHRMLHNVRVDSLNRLGADILDHFHVKKYPFRDGDEPEARRKWLRDLRAMEAGEHKIGAYIVNTNGYYLLTLRDRESYAEFVDLDFSAEWKLLDVNILNTLIMENILGTPEDQLSAQGNITYTKDVEEAISTARSGDAQVAFILNPTALKDVITIAENNEIMPRKSTYFYPKPVSGLVFYPMEAGFHVPQA